MPNNWKTYKLGEVAEVQNGFAFKSADLGKEGIPVVKIKNIIPPYVDVSDADCFNGEIDKKLEKYILRKGDFLISMTGSTVNVMSSAVGKMGRYRLDQESLLNQRAGKIYVKKPDLADFDFMCHYLNRYEVHYNLALNATGSANQANISPAQIKDIDLILPPLPEQQAIAAILSSLDDKIELNLQMNKTLEEMAMTLYKHWFVDFGPFKDGEFVDSELGLIPEGWEVKRLDEVAHKKSETFDFSDKQEVVFVNTGDVQEGRFLHSNLISKVGLPGQAKKAISEGDILYSEIRPKNKRYAYVNFDSSNYVVSTKFMIINPKENILNKLLYRILTMQSSVDLFDMIAEGRSGTFPQITFDAISEMEVILPPLKIQQDFQDIVSDMEIQQDQLHLENQTLTTLRDTLLPKLISGEVRVKEAAQSLASIM